MDRPISDHFTFVNNFKKYYVQKMVSLEKTISTYFNQVNNISKLQEENAQLKKYEILATKTSHELDSLNKILSHNELSNVQLSFTNVLSYVNFDDFTKVWLDFPKPDKKILGLISNNYAAGIIKQVSGKSLGLLNGNPKANYAVYIGITKAPGIVHGEHQHLLVIKYIPIWMTINVNDEVITSGMDNIFFEGLKVGKVVKINKMADMQEAYVAPYINVLNQKHFYVYENLSKDAALQAKNTNKQP